MNLKSWGKDHGTSIAKIERPTHNRSWIRIDGEILEKNRHRCRSGGAWRNINVDGDYATRALEGP